MINFACGDNNNNNGNKSESAQFMAWQELPGRAMAEGVGYVAVFGTQISFARFKTRIACKTRISRTHAHWET